MLINRKLLPLYGAAFLCVLSVCSVEVPNAIADELSEAERKQAVTSLRKYHLDIGERHVELNARVTRQVEGIDQAPPFSEDFLIVHASDKMFTEEHIVVSDPFGNPPGDGEVLKRQTMFDLKSGEGLEALLREDGTMTQAKQLTFADALRKEAAVPIAQALGWLAFFPADRVAVPAIDPAEALRDGESVRRTVEGEITATITDPRGVHYELRFTDLPDVRMTGMNATARWGDGRDALYRVEYRKTGEDLFLPAIVRVDRAGVSQTATIEQRVAAPADEERPFPEIKILPGVQLRPAMGRRGGR